MVARSIDSCRSALSQIAAGRREFTPSKIHASRMTLKFPKWSQETLRAQVFDLDSQEHGYVQGLITTGF